MGDGGLLDLYGTDREGRRGRGEWWRRRRREEELGCRALSACFREFFRCPIVLDNVEADTPFLRDPLVGRFYSTQHASNPGSRSKRLVRNVELLFLLCRKHHHQRAFL